MDLADVSVTKGAYDRDKIDAFGFCRLAAFPSFLILEHPVDEGSITPLTTGHKH